MDSTNVNHHPAVPGNAKTPNEFPMDVSYLPASETPNEPPPAYSVSPMTSYPAEQPMQSCLYPMSSVFLTENQYPYQGILVPASFLVPRTAHIRDYLAWSILNVFLGGVLLGVPAVLCSLMTRARKEEGDAAGATSLSRITLAVNIVITSVFFMLTAFLIVYFIAITSVITAA